jgi:hypothetical protein
MTKITQNLPALMNMVKTGQLSATQIIQVSGPCSISSGICGVASRKQRGADAAWGSLMRTQQSGRQGQGKKALSNQPLQQSANIPSSAKSSSSNTSKSSYKLYPPTVPIPCASCLPLWIQPWLGSRATRSCRRPSSSDRSPQRRRRYGISSRFEDRVRVLPGDWDWVGRLQEGQLQVHLERAQRRRRRRYRVDRGHRRGRMQVRRRACLPPPAYLDRLTSPRDHR